MGGYHARGGKQFNGHWERTRLTTGGMCQKEVRSIPRSHEVVYGSCETL